MPLKSINLPTPLSQDEMKRVGAHYEEYEEPYRLDPFKKIHWGVVEDWQEKAHVTHVVDASGRFMWGCVLKPVKSDRGIKDFTTNKNATLLAGETECLMFGHTDGHLDKLADYLKQHAAKGLWFTRCNVENPKNVALIAKLGASLVSSKIAGVGSEMYGIYYLGPRRHAKLLERDAICFGRYKMRITNPAAIVQELLREGQDFKVTDRGTRYGGPDKTWTRVVIRNAGEDRALAEGQLCNHLQGSPRLLKIVEQLTPFASIDAVMLTRVRAGGIIVRHTDSALDRDVGSIRGFNTGMTLRTHFVLQSGPGCTFNIWDLDGTIRTVEMEAGEIWYSDVRRTHSVENKSLVDRLHLVVDVLDIKDLPSRLDHVVPNKKPTPTGVGYRAKS